MPMPDAPEAATRGLGEAPSLAETIALIERDLPGMDWTLTKRTASWGKVEYRANVLPPYRAVCHLSREQRTRIANEAYVRKAGTAEEALAKAYTLRMEATNG